MPATDVWFEQYSKRFCVSVYSEVIFTYLIVCRVYNIIASFTSSAALLCNVCAIVILRL